MRIILQEGYDDYQSACKTLGALTLAERRTNLCYKFARKNLYSENSFFTRVGTTVNTRQKNIKVREFKCNFGRFSKSSLPYLATLLNSKT